MSKQQAYQQPGTEYAPSGEDYGFAARLPQAGGSYPTEKASGAQSAYPGAASYAGAPATGYPVMTTPAMAGGMAGPRGMGAEDPLGRKERRRLRKEERRNAKGGKKGGPKILLMLFLGPVGLVLGVARRVIRMGMEHHREQPHAPAQDPGTAGASQPY